MHGLEAIHYATAKNRLDILKFIIDHDDGKWRGESLGRSDFFPLWNNVYADINAQDHNGDTALHFAVMNNAVDCLSYLIESGANSSILNNEMNGPIHVAIIMNQVDILKVRIYSITCCICGTVSLDFEWLFMCPQEMVKHKDKVNVMLRGKHGRVSTSLMSIFVLTISLLV